LGNLDTKELEFAAGFILGVILTIQHLLLVFRFPSGDFAANPSARFLFGDL
jgi:hypothetical protein